MNKYIGGAAAVAALIFIWVAAVPRPVSAQASFAPFTAFGPGSWIGVTARDVTSDDAAKAKLPQPVGVFVESVRDGSPAARAGIRVADIIVDFGGERIRSVRQFTRLVQESAPRRAVAVAVMRGTERQTLDVVPEFSGEFLGGLLGQRDGRFPRLPERFGELAPPLRRQLPREFDLYVDPDLRRRRLFVDGPSLGVVVTPLSDQLAAYFGVKGGALVSSVDANSPAADAGIKAGDVITAIDGRTVTTAADIAAALREARAGEGVDVSVTRDRKPLMLKVMPGQAASGRGGLPV